MSLPMSIQVMKQTRIENEKYYSKRNKARKMFKPLQKKYPNYGLGDIPNKILTKKEKLLLYRCFRCYMDIESSSMLAFSDTCTGYIIEEHNYSDETLINLYIC